MTIPAYTRPDNTTQTGTAYKANLDAAATLAERLGLSFLAQAQTSPNMTVRVLAGALLVAGAPVEVAAQNTGTITAPATNPRIDRVVIDAATGAVSVVTGTEAGSPVAPAIPAGKLPVARIALATSTTQITASLLTDERIAGGGLLPASETLAGILEISTNAENTTGTDNTRAVSPKGLTEWTPASATIDIANDEVLIRDASDGGKAKRVPASSLGFTAATQAEQEAGSTTAAAVTPGRQQFHPSAAKAWALFNTVTTTTNLASYNVASLTDNGTGDTTVNFTTAFSSANFAAVGVGRVNTSTGYTATNAEMWNPSASSVRLQTGNGAGSLVDCAVNSVACFGDQ